MAEPGAGAPTAPQAQTTPEDAWMKANTKANLPAAPAAGGNGAAAPAAPVQASAGAAATLENPFGIKAVQVEIDKLLPLLDLEPLRGLVVSEASNAFARYLDAINTVDNNLSKAEADAAKMDQLQFEIMIAMAVVIAIPLTAPAAVSIMTEAKLGAYTLRQSLVTSIAKNAKPIMTSLGVKSDIAAEISTQMILVAANESIRRSASRIVGDAPKILGEATKSMSKAVKVAASTGKFACGHAFLAAMKKAVDGSKGVLDTTIADAGKDLGKLLAICHSLLNNPKTNNIESCTDNVQKQLDNFMNGVADAMVARARAMNNQNSTKDTIVKMDAYGSIHYAPVLEHVPSNPILPVPLEITYTFVAWIIRDLEGVAESMHPKLIDPKKSIVGRLPDPGF